MVIIRPILNRCHEDEFTCADGICIPSDQRCDMVQHCEDYTDELECDTVSLTGF